MKRFLEGPTVIAATVGVEVAVAGAEKDGAVVTLVVFSTPRARLLTHVVSAISALAIEEDLS